MAKLGEYHFRFGEVPENYRDIFLSSEGLSRLKDNGFKVVGGRGLTPHWNVQLFHGSGAFYQIFYDGKVSMSCYPEKIYLAKETIENFVLFDLVDLEDAA